MKIILAMLFVLLWAVPVSPAHAAERKNDGTIYRWGKPSKGLDACHDDIQRWCKDVVPGDSRIGNCLYAHLNELSTTCLTFARHGGKGHELESLIDIDKAHKVKPSTREGNQARP